VSRPPTVGFLGGGQLARMMALAGAPLGVHVVYVDPKERAPAAIAAEGCRAELGDAAAWEWLAERADVVSYEVEHVPVEAVEWLAKRVPVRPGVEALRVTGDRWHEKRFLADQGIPTAAFAKVDGPEDAERAAEVGLPGILKTRTHGYDGRGQIRVATLEDLRRGAEELARPAIYERFVTFERELSLLGVRSLEGEMRFWPLVENDHREGILQTTHAPAEVAPDLRARAERKLGTLLGALDYVGVLCVELFDTGEQLLANELAPRVHNSGHWTIEGAVTSQFENHLRAILGWPLGETSARGFSRMCNCVGRMPSAEHVLAVPGAHLHDYEKSPRPARKVAHVTLTAASREGVEAAAEALGDEGAPFE